MSWTAYVDECEVVLGGHAYSMAASLVDDGDTEAVADALLPLKFPGSGKLHWYDEHKTDRRKLLATTVAQLAGVEHVVVVLATTPPGTPPNRRRRQCLMRLLPELRSLGVSHVIAEARESKQNARDVQSVFALRHQRLVDRHFRRESRTRTVQPPAVGSRYRGGSRQRRVRRRQHLPRHPRP